MQTITNECTFVNVCSLLDEPIIIASTSGSNLNIYHYDKMEIKLFRQISLENLYSNQFQLQESSSEDGEQSYASCLCIGLQVFNIGDQNRIEFNQARKNSNTIIVCGTPQCLFFIEYSTGNLIYMVDFKSVSFRQNATFMMPQTIDFCLVRDRQINAAFLFLFQNEISIVKCADICANKSLVKEISNHAVDSQNELLTVIPK
jgi:hypothetical protein